MHTHQCGCTERKILPNLNFFLDSQILLPFIGTRPKAACTTAGIRDIGNFPESHTKK